MNLTEFFESEAVTLPVGGFEERKETFDTFLRRVFDTYLLQVKDLVDPAYPDICTTVGKSLELTSGLCDQIILALVHYLAGDPSQAYQEFDRSLAEADVTSLTTSLGGGVVRQSPRIIPLRGGAAFLDKSAHPVMYRMRAPKHGPVSGGLSREQIFHVPFEQRHLVRNQRYSIAGLPCLYLGSSTWVCWEELGRPDLDRVFVSLFLFEEDVNVLDFQFPPREAWGRFKQAQDELKNSTRHKSHATEFSAVYGPRFIEDYIRLWPLIAACSIKRGIEGSFHPQYIVPQMLLQWVCHREKVDGIRYFSTRIPRGGFPYSNLAFPTRIINYEGRCSHLQKKFRLTDPIAWSVLQEIRWRGSVDQTLSNHGTHIELSEGIPFTYAQTGFHTAELTLMYLAANYPDTSKQVKL